MQRIKSRIVNLNLIIIGLLLIAANPKDSTYINEKLEIYPLKIGNSWTYQEYIYHGDSIHFKSKEVIVKIVKDSLINNNIYFLKDYDGDQSNTLSINKEDGFYLNEPYQSIADLQLFYKYPCKIGEKWRNKLLDIDPKYKPLTVVKSLDNKITVPYGTIECILYETESKNRIGRSNFLYILYQIYVKPGLGVVKVIVSNKNEINGNYKIVYYRELKSAIIK